MMDSPNTRCPASGKPDHKSGHPWENHFRQIGPKLNRRRGNFVVSSQLAKAPLPNGSCSRLSHVFTVFSKSPRECIFGRVCLNDFRSGMKRRPHRTLRRTRLPNRWAPLLPRHGRDWARRRTPVSWQRNRYLHTTTSVT